MHKKSVRTFDDFMKVSNRLYLSFGVEQRIEGKQFKHKWLLSILFYLGLINLNVCVLLESIYFFKTFGSFSTFLEATASAPCIGECLISDFKLLAAWWNQNILKKLMNNLIKLYPKTKKLQDEYELKKYENNVLSILVPFLILYFFLVWMFHLLPIFESLYEYFYANGQMNFINRLPFFAWYPYDVKRSTLAFILTYFHQAYAGQIAISWILSADILLCTIIAQLCMHFNFISKKLNEFVPTGNEENDYAVLKKYIEYHTNILQLTDYLNEIFSTSTLYNFLASSMVICLVGFQVTIGTSYLDLYKFSLFLVTSVCQILIICYYGNCLIDSSNNVGHKIYNQFWFDANIKYKKMLILIIQRAQKPAFLKATLFPPISLITFKKTVAMSYQFFALLRTIYSK